MTEPFTGGCLCGALRYECAAAPIVSGHCQCRDCQRISGTGHSSNMMVPRAAFSVSGESRVYERKADSGNTVSRAFCPTCGVMVYASNSGFPDGVFLRAGSLDDPSAFKPSIVVYASRGQAWDRLDADLPRVPEMPDADMMAELLA